MLLQCIKCASESFLSNFIYLWLHTDATRKNIVCVYFQIWLWVNQNKSNLFLINQVYQNCFQWKFRPFSSLLSSGISSAARDVYEKGTWFQTGVVLIAVVKILIPYLVNHLHALVFCKAKRAGPVQLASTETTGWVPGGNIQGWLAIQWYVYTGI